MTQGRTLTCTQCATPIQVFEIPRPFIDPDLFVCGHCLKPARVQLNLEPRTETRTYNPAIAAIPY